MIRYFCLTLLIFCSLGSYLYSQEGTFGESVDFVGDPYAFDEIAFKITEVKNELADPNLLGIVHFGESKAEYRLLFDPELEKQFDKFFKQALRKSEQGEIAAKIIFKKLSVNVNTKDSTSLSELVKTPKGAQRVKEVGTKNWKNRTYKIAVDYLVKNKLVYSDSAEVDSFAHMSEYSVDQFCSSFFKGSLDSFNQRVTALKLDSSSFLNKIERSELAQTAYLESLLDLKVRFKYKNKSKMKVLPLYTPEAIQDRIKQDYAEKAFGFYKFNVVYRKNDDDIEIVTIDEIKFASMQQIRTTRAVAWSLAAVIGFISGYQSAQQPVGPGPPTGP